ncbi:MAG TPA: hypothetical protein VNE39_09025 [Planctomycetota bacterium]|nr:hypothetical protein [Planctomycetota bacterium]
MSLPGLILALTAVLAMPPAPKPEAEPPQFTGIHVLVRTSDGLVTGHDLRYQDGAFRLRQEKGEATLAEAAVTQIQFLDVPHDEMKDPVVRLAAHVAYLRRAGPLKRLVLLQRFREGLFLRPGEPLAETFPLLVPRIWHPDLAALLCAEAAHRCLLERRPKDATALFEAAEAASKERPDHAFVYGLMRVASLHEAARPEDVQKALQELQRKHPDRWRDVARFRMFLREEGERPFPPRPFKGMPQPP